MNNIVAEVEKEVKAAEAKVEEVVSEVKAEVVKGMEKVRQELTDTEKLAIREIENSYLKTTMEIQRLSQITQKAQQDFTKKVEELTKQYAIDPALWLFDNVALEFRKK